MSYVTGKSGDRESVEHATLAEAEAWVEEQRAADPAGVDAGEYYIDGPCLSREARAFSELLIAGERERLKDWAAKHNGDHVAKTIIEALCSNDAVIDRLDLTELGEAYGLWE